LYFRRQNHGVTVRASWVYAMLENQSLWQTANECHRILAKAKIPHALMGGVAVCMHGYQRNTVDLDLLIRKEDADLARKALEREHYAWDDRNKEFRSVSGVSIQFLLSGDRAGPGSDVLLPDPGEKRATTEIEELPVLTLAKLIETKIACGSADLRRSHKDFADVVELIIHGELNSSFARFLHKSVRATYRKLVRVSRGES
jgi:hypothetical protein